MFRFAPRYFLAALLLFVVEVLIALYLHDPFIRPYAGDYLVVLLLYAALRSVLRIDARKAIVAVLLFAYAIEVGQYFHLVYRLGLGHSRLARVVLGTGFSWIDLLAYTLGAATLWWMERRRASEP